MRAGCKSINHTLIVLELQKVITRLSHSMTLVLACCALPILSGCTPPVTYQTPSGKPEAKITGRSVEETKTRIRNSSLRSGHTVVNETSQTITIQAVVTDPTQVMLFGSPNGGAPVYRIAYSLVPEGRDTVIIATSSIVSNAGTAFEKSQNLDSTGAGAEVQNVLNELAVDFSR